MKLKSIILFSIFAIFLACSPTKNSIKHFEGENIKSEKTIQQYATFHADTANLLSSIGNYAHYQEIKTQTKWIINNQILTYGSESIKVIPNPNKIDTILFQYDEKRGYDTLICNIAKPYSYKFTHNGCCGGFNVYSDSIKNRPSLLFKLNAPKNEKYLGILGSSGKLLTKQDTIKDFCKSAVTPNIYPIKLIKIEDCVSDNCEEIMCLIKDDVPDYIYDYYNYQIREEILSFLFMPLNNEPLEIFYDAKQQIIKIQ